MHIKTKVLVVDDDPQILDLVREILSGEGYDVTTARDFDSALVAFRILNPEIMLSDWNLGPGKDGIELVKAVKELSGAVYVVMFSGQAGIERFVPLAQAAGVIACLSKPFNIMELIRLIGQGVRQPVAA